MAGGEVRQVCAPGELTGLAGEGEDLAVRGFGLGGALHPVVGEGREVAVGVVAALGDETPVRLGDRRRP